MQPTEQRALCVAIHDVAPATWPECVRLLHAVRAVADIPLSWLVVPRYHQQARRSAAIDTALGQLLAQSHELVLHGYTHQDCAPLRAGRRWLRTVYTQREGEFAAIDERDARRRIELGLDWFRARAWPVQGFVAPAWLLGKQAWPLLAEYGFAYTTTCSHFHLLRPAHRQLAPALTYMARNAAGRAVSPPAASALARMAAGLPLLRLALHPRDAHHPALLRHAQGLIEHLLASRKAVTKAAFASLLAGPTSTDPSVHPGPSGRGHTTPNNVDGRTAPTLPWC